MTQPPELLDDWRRVMTLAVLLPIAAVLVAVLANGAGALPYALVVTVVLGGLALWTRRGGRVAPWVLATVAALYLAFSCSFGAVFYLQHPSSWSTFVGAGLEVLGVLTIVVALVLRQRLPASKKVVAGLMWLALALVVTAVVATADADDPAPRAGDVRVSMRPDGSAFACQVPAVLDAGRRGVFVRNDDTVPHRLSLASRTIDVRAGGTARAVVALSPGRLGWRCVYVAHTDVTGASTVR